MMFLVKILLRTYILSIFPIAVTSTNPSQIGLIALPNSEIPVTNGDSIVNPFVDLDADDNRNQTVKRTKKIPEKRKHNPEISSECQSSKRCRTRRRNIQDSFLGENTAGYLGKFRHELSGTFLGSKDFFDLESYDQCLIFNGSVLIEEFYSKEQLQNIEPNVFHEFEEMIVKNLEKLEIYAKRVVTEYVEILKHQGEDHGNFYASISKALDPERTKGFYYLLIYSLYETGLIGGTRCMAAVEKIFINIITHTRLMAYMHNYKVKEEIKLKKLYLSKGAVPKVYKYKKTKYVKTNFSYTDFTKPLTAKPFKKYDLFHKNADLMRKEINYNIQLIINEESGGNLEYKNLCEDYNSNALEFNRSILFERFSFQIGKNVGFKYTDGVTAGFDFFVYNFGYSKNILSRLMDTDTKNQIKEFADIKLKSVFILIFISKLCLCNVTDLCTLPEYLILIGSLQEAYNKHKAGQDKTIANFQSLTSYFFSLHYLDKDQEEDRREEAKEVIGKVFPEYNEIFPNFDSEIDDLKDE